MTNRLLLLSDDKSLVDIFNALDGFETHVSEETWYLGTICEYYDVVIADIDNIRLTGNIKGIIQNSSVAFAVISPENLPNFEYGKNLFHDIWVKPIHPSLVPNRIAKGMEYKALKLSKAHFFQYLRHQIKDYVTPIVGYSDILKGDGIGELSIQQKQCMELIYTHSRKIMYFMDNFLDLTKLEMRLELFPDVITVSDIIEQLQIPRVSEEFADKDVGLLIDVPNELPPIFVDAIRICQVLTFLLSNGLKFTPAKGHVILSAKIEHGKRIHFSVKDTGVGFEEKSIETMLGRIYEDTNDSSVKSLQLGLRFAHYLIYESGSKLEMESELGKGSTFHFTVPIAKDNPS